MYLQIDENENFSILSLKYPKYNFREAIQKEFEKIIVHDNLTATVTMSHTGNSFLFYLCAQYQCVNISFGQEKETSVFRVTGVKHVTGEGRGPHTMAPAFAIVTVFLEYIDEGPE